MAPIATTSTASRLPVTDGRSAEAQYLKRLRADLRQHVGGAPTIAQKLLIDRVAHTALRIHALDCEPLLPENGEFLELTRLLTDLLGRLGVPVSATQPPKFKCLFVDVRRIVPRRRGASCAARGWR